MAEKPIIFSTPMVQAILDGRKTQFRLVIKFPKHAYRPDVSWVKAICQDGGGNWVAWSSTAPDIMDFTKKAYPNGEGFPSPYQPGDRLLVRETWQYCPTCGGINWKAGGNDHGTACQHRDEFLGKWKSPIFMPKEAARLWLTVTGVNAERVQDISESDAIAEGVYCRMDGTDKEYGFNNDWWWHHGNAFARLWDSINAKRGYGWDTNPWVWVYTFEVEK